MRLTLATTKAIQYACKHFHYSHCSPLKSIGYNVYNGNDEWCGVILYGRGATPAISSPYGLSQGQVLELTRVALNGKQETTSQAVAMSLKALKKDYPLVKLVVSYADIDQSHLGTIYQATNWIYEGESCAGTMSGFIINGKKVHKKSIYDKMVFEDGKWIHCPQTIEMVRKYFDKDAQPFITAGKRKYLMPMDKQMKKFIAPLAKPYPKNDDWVKIDRQTFKQNKSD